MPADHNTSSSRKPGILGFWQELRRRKVIRVGSVYLVTGWIIIQVASATFSSFGIPNWAFRFVTLMVLLGLPVALVIAWAFELTPDGIKTSQSLTAETESADTSKALNKKRNWHAYALGALLPSLIFGALALYFYVQLGNSSVERDGSTAEAGKSIAQSIAVMPLVNMSSHAENQYFAGGIHEDLLTNLSRIKDLQVVSRTSMLKYATSELALNEIGKELGVDYIVEGSVRRINNHVRVTVQLINANNDRHLWANNFERELVDVFATQSELARVISNSLHQEIQPESVEKLQGMPTSSVEAYDRYIQSIAIEKTIANERERLTRRRELLEQAVAEDPNFVEAWAELKRVYDLMRNRLRNAGWFVGVGQDKKAAGADLQARSRRAMEKALALDPDNVETLLSRAVDHVWPKTDEQMQEMKALLDRIIETYPEHAYAWYHLGWWYYHLDPPQHKEAMAAFEEALKRDPFNGRIVGAALNRYQLLGDQENVTRLSERLSEIAPETADDRKLARITLATKQAQVRELFLETADESYVDELEKIQEQRVTSEDRYYHHHKAEEELRIRIFSNEQNRVLEMANKPVSAADSSWIIAVNHWANSLALKIQLIEGRQEEARAIARRILAMDELIRSQNLHLDADIVVVQAEAFAVLGDVDKARKIVEDSLRNPKLRGDENFVDRISAMSHIDTDRAVDLAFAELTRYPNWDGFDHFAAYHLMARPLLAHPKVQAYYVKEGKWIDYLAKRVPEYAR